MWRVFILAAIVAYAAPHPHQATAQTTSQQRPQTPGRASENPSDRVRELEAELADREAQNALLIERVRELQKENDSLKNDAISGIERAAGELDQALGLLEQRHGVPLQR